MTGATLLAISALFAAPLAGAPDLSGAWVGTLPNAGSFRALQRIVVNLSIRPDGKLTASAFAGRLGDIALNCSSVSWDGSKLRLTIQAPAVLPRPASFVGTLSTDGNSIEGWLENQRLRLERTGRSPETRPPPAAAGARDHDDSSALLARALRKLADTESRLVRYTCIETIQRTYYSHYGGPASQLGSDAMTEAPPDSCKGVQLTDHLGLTVNAEDRLRLAVAVADGQEIQSWAGADRFDSRSVFDLVRDGPLNTGAFGTVLLGVFANPRAEYHYIGTRIDGPLRFSVYSFQVPLSASHYAIKAGRKWRMTGYFGSFEIDQDTAALARVSMDTTELSSDTQMCRARNIIDYHYLPIGKDEFLIPSRAEFDTVSPNGAQTESVATFSACHEYTAESSVVFDSEPDSKTAAASRPAPPLPPGLSLTLALLAPIDTGTAAAGDAITARVTKAVRAPRSEEVLVPAGAIAHGRILAMQHLINSSQFRYSLHFDALDQNGAVRPLAIRLERELNAEQRSSKSLSRHGTEFSLSPQSPQGEMGNWFAVPAVNGRCVVRAGSESKWVTVQP